jgi:hypothetical protein
MSLNATSCDALTVLFLSLASRNPLPHRRLIAAM